MYFSKFALVKIPATTVHQGLRLEDRGTPDVKKALVQHQKYRDALSKLGFTLIVLPPDDKYPDSVFVEDPVIIIGKTMIIGKMRRRERQGEEEALHHALAPFFQHRLMSLFGPLSFLEGGDVLITPKRLFIGLSERTNQKGATELARFAKKYYQLETNMIELPKHLLHLKGQVSFHRGEGTSYEDGLLLISEELLPAWIRHPSPYRAIRIPHEERFGANAISEKYNIIIHAGRPQTKKLLEHAGFHTIPVPMSEFEKIDGALSCMSKIFEYSKW